LLPFNINSFLNNPQNKIFTLFFLDLQKNFMKDFTTYLSTAPVVSFLYFGFLAGLLIEINRFYPDALVFPFLG